MNINMLVTGLIIAGSLWMFADLLGILDWLFDRQENDDTLEETRLAKEDDSLRIVRMSIPGNACIHCGTIMDENLVCGGCGWIDPVTIEPEKEESLL